MYYDAIEKFKSYTLLAKIVISKDNTRRTFLQLTSTAFGGIAASSLASAKGNGKAKGGGSGDINTNFDPDDKVEVAKFAKGLKDVNNLRGVFKQLTDRQRIAIRDILQPVEVNVNAKVLTNESSVSLASSWQSATAVYTAYAVGQWPYDRLWQFTHEANWEYNGDEVQNVSHRHAVSTSHPLWHWKTLIDGSKNVRGDDFIAYKQGKFAYCEPLKVGCVASDTPYIEITGDENGNSSAESNYQT